MATEGAKPTTAGSTATAKAGGRAGTLAKQAARRPANKPAAATAPFEVGQFEHGGVTMYYEVHGSGPRVFVFMHGILLDANLNRRLATDLAAVGNQVILLDLPGHGLSEKPRRASYHRMDTYARHVEALLDHLGVDKAVVGGVSLGGNVALLVGSQSPQRVQGLVVEMPVLEWAVPAAAITFVPMLMAVHLARRVVRVAGTVVRRLPRTGFGPFDSVMNTLSNDPVEIAAVLHGVLTGPIGPTVDERDNMHVPTLVIGHGSDSIHPFRDAEQLAHRLPDARLVQAKSMLELRLRPERLTGEIARFLDSVWGTAGTGARPRSRRRASWTHPDASAGDHSVEIRPRPALPLALGLVPLGRQASLGRSPGRARRTPGLLDTQGVGHPRPEAFDGQLPVADLRSFVVGHHPQLRAETLEEPGPLAGPQRGRPGHVEPQLHPRAHLVGVLTTGPAAGRKPELQLGQGNGQRRRDPDEVTSGRSRRHRARGSPAPSPWTRPVRIPWSGRELACRTSRP